MALAPPSRDLRPIGAVTGLTVLVVGLAAARLITGPWYAVYAPKGAELLTGWPAAWEALYYTHQLPTFLGDAPVIGGIAAVQYRTLLNLYLTSLATAWTGSAYWSLALVDLAMWMAGCVATYYLMRRLGASPFTAALGAGLTAASPILVSNMWRHDLHAANFATMPLGLWAVLVLLDEPRRPARLGLALGAVFLLLSLSYQFQWVLFPVAVVLGWRHSKLPRRAVAFALVLAIGVLLAGTWFVRAGLDVAGLSARGLESTAVQQPEQLVVTQLSRPGAWAALLPQRRHVEATLHAYHPIVLLIGALGLARIGGAAALAGLVASAVSLWAITLYPAPWTAMSAYPFIYLGAGVACTELGRLAASPVRRVPAGRWVEALVAVAAALALAALTNGDLWGDYRFLLAWWRLYFPQTVF